MSDPIWSQRAAEIVIGILVGQAREWPDEIRSQAEYLSAIWVYSGWWNMTFLGVNGQVFVIGEKEDHPDALTVHTERGIVLTSLVAGSKRYPELKELLPVREPGAIDCPCRKIPIFASGKVFCDTCGCLGWLPPDPA